MNRFLVLPAVLVLLLFSLPGMAQEKPESPQSAAAVIETIIYEKGIEAAGETFAEMRSESGDKYSFEETEFSDLGWRLIRHNKLQAAFQVFRMNVEQFPQSIEAAKDTAWAFLYLGKKEEAVTIYKKILEQTPDDRDTNRKLAQIDAESKRYLLETREPVRFAEGENTGLQGPYLGQDPPGETAVVFAPGIVSTIGNHEFCCTFSPDGKECYFNRYMVIMVSRWEEDGWSAPEPAEFTGSYRAHEPHITGDNKTVFFGSFRPQPGSDEKEPYGIWFAERIEGGWGEPSFAGRGMYVTTSTAGNIYLTDNSEGTPKEHGIAVTTLVDGWFGELVRLKGGPNSPPPGRLPGRHPCISPDESFILFDSYKDVEYPGEGALFISFRNEDGSWGAPINLGEGVNTSHHICASLSPDGKYLFFQSNSDIYWVSTGIFDKLRK